MLASCRSRLPGGFHVRTRIFGSTALLWFGCLAAVLGPVSLARADTAVQIQVSVPNFAGVPIDGSYGALDLQTNIGLAIGPRSAVELDRISLTLAPPQPGSPYNTPIEVEVEGPSGWSPVFNGLAGTATAPLVDPGTGQPPQLSSASTATIHLRVRLSTPPGRCTVSEKLNVGFPQAQILNSGTAAGSAQVTVTQGLLIGGTDYNLSSPPPCAAPLPPSGSTRTQAPTPTPSSHPSASSSAPRAVPDASTPQSTTTPASTGSPMAPASSTLSAPATSSPTPATPTSLSSGSNLPAPTEPASPQSPTTSPGMAPSAVTSPRHGASPLPWILAMVATAAAAGGGIVLRRRRSRDHDSPVS